MSCDQVRIRELQAYYDAELPDAQRAAVERHVGGCVECRRELEQMRALSRMLASGERAGIPAEALAQLHGHVDVWRESGVLRLAEVLTAAAAAVLFVGLIGLFVGSSTSASAAAPAWEQAAAMPRQVASEAPASDAESHIAQWINTDLSQQASND
jgi:anti-sigma factor RsiW